MKKLRRGRHPGRSLGDFNEHAEAYCRVTGGTSLEAAAAGRTTGHCSPPDPMRVDWIFGSTGAEFSDFLIDTCPGAPDHRPRRAHATVGVSYPGRGFVGH